ncbi:MAG: hypothetical protein HY696_07200 [Deltaproteobacteria bacterium]|nr:hypothetical protein [Deltaproteobacteria bacterium]
MTRKGSHATQGFALRFGKKYRLTVSNDHIVSSKATGFTLKILPSPHRLSRAKARCGGQSWTTLLAANAPPIDDFQHGLLPTGHAAGCESISVVVYSNFFAAAPIPV